VIRHLHATPKEDSRHFPSIPESSEYPFLLAVSLIPGLGFGGVLSCVLFFWVAEGFWPDPLPLCRCWVMQYLFPT